MTKWLSEKKCDFCGKAEANFFVDGKTKQGPWALMCPDCWKKHGCGKLGTGYGQMYNGETLEKVTSQEYADYLQSPLDPRD